MILTIFPPIPTIPPPPSILMFIIVLAKSLSLLFFGYNTDFTGHLIAWDKSKCLLRLTSGTTWKLFSFLHKAVFKVVYKHPVSVQLVLQIHALHEIIKYFGSRLSFHISSMHHLSTVMCRAAFSPELRKQLVLTSFWRPGFEKKTIAFYKTPIMSNKFWRLDFNASGAKDW